MFPTMHINKVHSYEKPWLLKAYSSRKGREYLLSNVFCNKTFMQRGWCTTQALIGQKTNLCFQPDDNTRFTYKIRSELSLSWPLLSTPIEGSVRKHFGFNASECWKSGLHFWYVSTMPLVSLATSCMHKNHQLYITISSPELQCTRWNCWNLSMEKDRPELLTPNNSLI